MLCDGKGSPRLPEGRVREEKKNTKNSPGWEGMGKL